MGTTPNGLHPGPGPLTGTPISATGVVVSVQPQHRGRASHGRRRRLRDGSVQHRHPGRRPLGRVHVQDLRPPGPAGERLPPDRQRERRRTVHVPRHPRDVPRPVHGGELQQQRRRWRDDPLADLALVELRLRAARPDRRHRQGGAAGAPDGDHHAAGGSGVDAAGHQGGVPDRHGGGGGVHRGGRHVQRAVLHRPRRGTRRRGDPCPRAGSSPGRVRSVGAARRGGAGAERGERHRHPGPDPRSARRGEDGHRAGCQRRLVRRLHAVPGHGRVDRHTGRQVRGPHRRHRDHRRLVPSGDVGPVHAGVARGPAGARVRGARADHEVVPVPPPGP